MRSGGRSTGSASATPVGSRPRSCSAAALCGERNVVKDGWFVCQVCGGDLPESWNFEAG